MVSFNKIIYLLPIVLVISDDVIDVIVTFIYYYGEVWFYLAVIFFALWGISKLIVKKYGQEVTLDDYFRGLTHPDDIMVWKMRYLYFSSIIDSLYAISSMILTKMILKEQFDIIAPTLLIIDFLLGGGFAFIYVLLATNMVENKRKDRSDKIAFARDLFEERKTYSEVRESMKEKFGSAMDNKELRLIRESIKKLAVYSSTLTKVTAQYDKIVIFIAVCITMLIFFLI